MYNIAYCISMQNENPSPTIKKAGIYPLLERAAAIASTLPITVTCKHPTADKLATISQMGVVVNHNICSELAMCTQSIPANAEQWLKSLKFKVVFDDSGATAMPADFYTHLSILLMQRDATISAITRAYIGSRTEYMDDHCIYRMVDEGLLCLPLKDVRPLKEGWDILPLDRLGPPLSISHLDGVGDTLVQKLKSFGYHTTANFHQEDQAVLQQVLEKKEHKQLWVGLWNMVLDQ